MSLPIRMHRGRPRAQILGRAHRRLDRRGGRRVRPGRLRRQLRDVLILVIGLGRFRAQPHARHHGARRRLVQVVERDQDHVLGLGARGRRAVTKFNATHPSICVTLEDLGAGTGEYVKLSNALKAGTGAPDVAEVEFDAPLLRDPAQRGQPGPVRRRQVQARLRAVGLGRGQPGQAVYAMPSDSGPMAFYYNSKVLAKYHVTPPTTWAELPPPTRPRRRPTPRRSYRLPRDRPAVGDEPHGQDGAWPFPYSGGAT